MLAPADWASATVREKEVILLASRNARASKKMRTCWGLSSRTRVASWPTLLWLKRPVLSKRYELNWAPKPTIGPPIVELGVTLNDAGLLLQAASVSRPSGSSSAGATSAGSSSRAVGSLAGAVDSAAVTSGSSSSVPSTAQAATAMPTHASQTGGVPVRILVPRGLHPATGGPPRPSML